MDTQGSLRIQKINGSYDIVLNNTKHIYTENCYEIENNVVRILEESDMAVYFNLKGIRNIDSAGLNVLIRLHRLAYLSNNRFILYDVNREVVELIELFGLTELEIEYSNPFYSNLLKAS